MLCRINTAQTHLKHPLSSVYWKSGHSGPEFSSWLAVPGKPPKGGAQEESEPDVRTTSADHLFWSLHSSALLRLVLSLLNNTPTYLNSLVILPPPPANNSEQSALALDSEVLTLIPMTSHTAHLTSADLKQQNIINIKESKRKDRLTDTMFVHIYC